MELLEQNVALVEQKPGYDGLIKHVEKCGRTCYKSEDRITEGSAEKFIQMLLDRKHYSPMEHGAVVIKADDTWDAICHKHGLNPAYNRFFENENGIWQVTNLRFLIEREHMSLDSIKDIFQEMEVPNPIKRITLRLTTSRAILDELLRHRTTSASVESTRYCNYSKDKFNNQVPFIKPSDWDDMPESTRFDYVGMLYYSQLNYLTLINQDLPPQRARDVLPLAVKTEACVTCFIDDWIDIIKKRTVSGAHPDMIVLANMIKDRLIWNKYLKEEDFKQ